MDIDPALFEENERTGSARLPTIVSVGPLNCEAGGQLPNVDVAYMTWGQLNSAKSNAILVCHALSGNADCVQWWSRIIGPGKALDTDKYFIIGVNALGGCDGSTGPKSLHPDGSPYGSRFPMVTVGDMVEAQRRLLDHLGIGALLMVCGGSMGGMQALEWSRKFPDRVRSIWMTASCAAHNAMQIGFNEAARQAILRDPKWLGGDYPPNDPPVQGLSVARMIGHLSFLSEYAFEQKFRRRLQDKLAFEYSWAPEFQVESYLNYQGDKFTTRFDANSLLVLTRAIDYYEADSFAQSNVVYLLTSFTSDWLYTASQSEWLSEALKSVGNEVEWHNLDVPLGHDAFLLDDGLQAECVRKFLARLND